MESGRRNLDLLQGTREQTDIDDPEITMARDSVPRVCENSFG